MRRCFSPSSRTLSLASIVGPNVYRVATTSVGRTSKEGVATSLHVIAWFVLGEVMRHLSIAVIVASVIASAAPASATSLAACGQVVAGDAVLDADLDCSTHGDGPAVSLDEGTLQLNGFRLVGNAGQPAVACTGPCKLRGPGRIEGGLHSVRGVWSHCDIRRVSMDGAIDDSVSCSGADIRKSTISGAGGHGFHGTRLRISRSAIIGCAERGVDTATALTASRVDVRDCGGIGLYCFGPPPGQKVQIRSATVENNGGSGIGVFISTEPVRIARSIIRGNRHGIWGNTSFKVSGCEISGNDVAGTYIGEGLSISDSSVTGNCLNWDPESWDCCTDLWAEGGLDLRKTTCGTSGGGGLGGGSCASYGLCTLD